MLKDWNACAREVGRALARYDGHSTYATLRSLLEAVHSSLLRSSPTCYAGELISEIQARGIGRVAAQAHVRHAIALGLLQRVTSAGGLFKPDLITKIDETARIGLAFLGRSVRAARLSSYRDYEHFLITAIVLEHDYDMYGVMLTAARRNAGVVSITSFRDEWRSRLDVRQKWLEKALPHRPARDRIGRYVSWQTRRLGDRTLHHHYNMRREWGRYLVHLDRDDRLTPEGTELANLILESASADRRTWLSPTPECLERLGLPSNAIDAPCSAWDLLRPPSPIRESDLDIVTDVATFMHAAFSTLRLQIIPQAPIASVLPYIRFLERQRGARYDTRQILETVVRRYRDTFYCMLTSKLDESHYQLRSNTLRPRREE